MKGIEKKFRRSHWHYTSSAPPRGIKLTHSLQEYIPAADLRVNDNNLPDLFWYQTLDVLGKVTAYSENAVSLLRFCHPIAVEKLRVPINWRHPATWRDSQDLTTTSESPLSLIRAHIVSPRYSTRRITLANSSNLFRDHGRTTHARELSWRKYF